LLLLLPASNGADRRTRRRPKDPQPCPHHAQTRNAGETDLYGRCRAPTAVVRARRSYVAP
jgi:hypothetical protein